jgi:hypothetical protein
MIDEKQRFSISPLTDRERVTLGMRMDDLLKFLGAPGDWGYGTAMGDLTECLIKFSRKHLNRA